MTSTVYFACLLTPDLAVAAVAPNQINLSWNNQLIENEQVWRVQRSTDGTHFSTIANVFFEESGYTDTTVEEGKEYWYRVRAVDDSGLGNQTGYSPKKSANGCINGRREDADEGDMLALSIKQPYAEMILRGIKTAELRSRSTRIIGRRFYIYASRRPVAAGVWSEDLQIAHPPAWMVELAEQVGLLEREIGKDAPLPTGVIVGTAKIARVIHPSPADGAAGVYRWELTAVRRFKRPRKITGRPQPMWWREG